MCVGSIHSYQWVSQSGTSRLPGACLFRVHARVFLIGDGEDKEEKSGSTEEVVMVWILSVTDMSRRFGYVRDKLNVLSRRTNKHMH